MSEHLPLPRWIDEADSLAAFIETAEEYEVTTEAQAEALIQSVWGGDVPLDRACNVLRWERERLAENGPVESSTSRAPRYMDLDDLELLSGYEFEHLLAEILRRVDGETTVTRASGGHGVDVVWRRKAETVGIHATAGDGEGPVRDGVVREIHAGATGSESGYSIDVRAILTTSRYTAGAEAAAEELDVRLYDRSDLERWLSLARVDAGAMGELLEAI